MACDDSTSRPANEDPVNAAGTAEVADESEDNASNSSQSNHSPDPAEDEEMDDENEEAEQPSSGTSSLMASCCVVAENPKSFRNSPYKLFVDPGKWQLCEQDDEEARYVLEEVRQRLLRTCAPGEGNWKAHPSAPTIKFLPLPLNPLLPANAAERTNFISPNYTHGLIQVNGNSETDFQAVSSESVLFKVIYGSPIFDVCGNRQNMSKVHVNFQVEIPPNSAFRIKNTDSDEAVLFFSCRNENAIAGIEF